MSLPAVAADEARRVATRAADELDVLLADTEAWVNVDSPSGDVARLDALAAAMAHRLSELGLEVELVPHEEGLHLHAVLEGAGDAGSPSSGTTTRSTRQARPRCVRSGATASGSSGPASPT